MKVQKFGGTSVGSAKRIRDVASLISSSSDKNIIVLSAMSGTTNSLLEIASALKENNKNKAKELIQQLYEKYVAVIDELFDTDEDKNISLGIVKNIFEEIKSFVNIPYTEKTEKEIVSKGEIISTNLMHQYMIETGKNVTLVPALDFMMIDENGDTDFKYI